MPSNGRNSGPGPSVALADITDGLEEDRWEIVTAQEHSRAHADAGGQPTRLRDVVVRATRRS